MIERLLSRRQAQVLRMLCAGQSVAEIAAALGLAENTIRQHRDRMQLRLPDHPLEELCVMAEDEAPGHSAP